VGDPSVSEEESEEGLQPLEGTEQLLGLLTLTGELAPSSTTHDAAADDSDSENRAERAQLQREASSRERAQLSTALGALLKEAVTTRAASPGLWDLLGRWYAMQGEWESAKEAWLKQVRVGESRRTAC